MRDSKSSAMDEILSPSGEIENDDHETASVRRPAARAGKVLPRGSQAWRAIEDMKDKHRLDRKLKEVYEEE